MDCLKEGIPNSAICKCTINVTQNSIGSRKVDEIRPFASAIFSVSVHAVLGCFCIMLFAIFFPFRSL